MSGLYQTPKDILRVLTKLKFQPDHSAEAQPGPTVWELSRKVRQNRKTQISVEVDERKGTWTVYSGETRQQGKGGTQLAKALKGALTEILPNKRGLTEMSTPQDIARILTKLQLRRRPDLDNDGMESWVDQKGRGNVEVSVSESGRWVIIWEEVRAIGFGLGRLVKQLIGYLSQKKRTNESTLTEFITPQNITHVLHTLKYTEKDEKGFDRWTSKNGDVQVAVYPHDRWTVFSKEETKEGHGIKELTKYLHDREYPLLHKNEQDIDEMTGTGGIAGFGTPYAFAGNDEDKKKVNEAFEALMEGTRSTSDEIEKMLKQAGYKNLGAGAGSADEWEKSYKSGTKTIFVNLAGWNVNGGPSGRDPWQLKRYLASSKKSVNEVDYGSGGLEVVKGGKVIDQLDMPSSGQYAHYKNKRYNFERNKKRRGWWFINLDKPLKEGYDRKDVGLTPPDMSRLLKRNAFFNSGDHFGVDIWDDGDVDVEVYEDGSWSIHGDSRVQKVNGKGTGSLAKALKNLTEGGDPYYGWRNDESQTPRQKIGNAITEINKQLKEVEKVVKRTQRLKKETGTSNNALWNRTNNALMKIESRMHRISQTIRNMRG